MSIKISAIGMAKSGTSALYSSIKTALPAPRRLLFEPNTAAELAYVTSGEYENALTKVMFGTLRRLKYDPSIFTHRVAIVRDPRDMIVSSTLFRFNRLKLINDKPLFDSLVDLFERKETDPHSLSLHDILEAAEPGGARAMKEHIFSVLQSYSAYLDEGSHHIITYDQMVAGDFDRLNAYLGLTLAPPPPLEGWVSKISRKGESGDWKNWFTEEDVIFFHDTMDQFVDKYGFDPEWTLEDQPLIAPKHCSHYIRRLSEARKVDPNRKKDVGSDMASLLSAAEDGKVNALTKLVDVYEGNGPDADPASAAKFSRQLAEMGYPKYMIKTARYFLKKQDAERAYYYLNMGIDSEYAPAYYLLADQYLKSTDAEKQAQAIALLERGRDLGGKKCAKRLAEISAESNSSKGLRKLSSFLR